MNEEKSNDFDGLILLDVVSHLPNKVQFQIWFSRCHFGICTFQLKEGLPIKLLGVINNFYCFQSDV